MRRSHFVIAVFGLLVAACGTTSNSQAVAPSAPSSSITTTTTTSTSTTSTTTTTSQPGVAPSVATASYTRSGSSPNYDVSVSYAVLGGMASLSSQASINSQIIASVANWANAFVQNVSMLQGASANGNSTLSGAFKTELVDSRIASFQFVLNQDVASAAHSNTNIYSLDFSLATGHQLGLTDLFVSGSNYLSMLSSASITLLTQQLSAQGVPASELENDPGLSAAPANFAAFDITSSGLVIGFSQGQVISTALGALTVTIPYTSLANVIAPKGPLVNP